MKAQICHKKGFINIVPDSYPDTKGYDFVQIKSIDFEVPKEGLGVAAQGKYYLDGTTLKKYTQEEIEQTPEYKEKILNELVSKEKEKAALKEVKKLRPDLSVEIDAKLAEL